MVAHDHQRPRPERRVEPAGRVGQDHDPRAELPEQQDGLDDEPRVVALVQVEAALEHDHRPPGQPAEEQPSGVPGRGRRGPAGQLRERDRDGILEVVRQPAEPGAEHDPDLGHEVGAGTHRGHQGGQPRRLFDGRDRARRVDRGRAGHRGLHYASRVDGRGRWLRRPDGSIDTGMPITSRRARACQAIVVRRRPGVATKRPKRPAAERSVP